MVTFDSSIGRTLICIAQWRLEQIQSIAHPASTLYMSGSEPHNSVDVGIDCFPVNLLYFTHMVLPFLDICNLSPTFFNLLVDPLDFVPRFLVMYFNSKGMSPLQHSIKIMLPTLLLSTNYFVHIYGVHNMAHIWCPHVWYPHIDLMHVNRSNAHKRFTFFHTPTFSF
ncbi:hypothetical protein YC2023_101883 [Brassica napus]